MMKSTILSGAAALALMSGAAIVAPAASAQPIAATTVPDNVPVSYTHLTLPTRG